MKRVFFCVEGMGFSAFVSLDGDYEISKLFATNTDGDEVELGNAFWCNIKPEFETAIREAAETAAKERE